MNWLAESIAQCQLTEETEEYLYGRGAKDETIQSEGFVTWEPTADPIPDALFCSRYGDRGQKLNGTLVCPVRSPRGAVIGAEFRSIHTKYIQDYRLPASSWNPFWIGTRRAMPALWAGANVWIVEGLFDLCALEWAIPRGDVVLASVRAHLARSHVEFLRRFCRQWVYLVYDQDVTGRKAMMGWVDENGKRRLGAQELLKRVGLRCWVVEFAGGKDPGEIWDKGGAVAVRETFGGSQHG